MTYRLFPRPFIVVRGREYTKVRGLVRPAGRIRQCINRYPVLWISGYAGGIGAGLGTG